MTDGFAKEASIHQTLHGYADGHSLLTASRQLKPGTRRSLLVLSDMSGPSMVPGFESYITGYPLSSELMYALAKTWHAKEMPRSGCVWTHTLLVNFDDLRNIPDLSVLLPLFRRPCADLGDRNNYERPLSLPLRGEPRMTTIHLPLAFLNSVACALYADDNPVFISADNADTYELLLLKLWSQQWPAMREGFHFCSGAIESRAIAESPFDLQVCPTHGVRQIQRTVPDASILSPQEEHREQAHRGSSRWAETIAAEWVREETNSFRDFAWHFGPPIGESRQLFGQLADIFWRSRDTHSSHEGGPSLVSLISSVFPTRTQGSELKTHVIRQRIWRQATPEARGELLHSMARHEQHAAFSEKELSIQALSAELWKQDVRQGTITLSAVTSEAKNPIRDAIIKGMSSAISSKQISHLAFVETEAACEVMKKRPELGVVREIWEHGREQRIQLIEALQEARNVPDELKLAIVKAQISANADDIIENISKWAGDVLVDGVLDWISQKGTGRGMASSWVRYVRSRTEVILKWLERHADGPPPTIAWCTRILNPKSALVRSAATSIWADLSSRLGLLDGQDATDASVFFLLVGLDRSEKEAARIVSSAFPPVYHSTLHDALSEVSWKQLKRQFGYSGWTWDRCSVLREEIVEVFAKRNWPKSEFVVCTRDHDMLRAILGKWWSRRERTFLREVAEGVKSGKLQVTTAQKHLFDKSLEAGF